MRKIIFHLTTGQIGTDAWENGSFPDDVTEDDLAAHAWELAVSNAEMYSIYNRNDYDFDGSDEDGEDDEDWGSDSYSDDIDGAWFDYNPEEHDGHTQGEWEWEEE